MNFVQTAPLLALYFVLFLLQFSEGYAGYIRGKDFVDAEEIRFRNQEIKNKKLNCGANNHDDGCSTISKRALRTSHSNQLTWNIDRLDQRHLPLDGDFCPLANGTGVDVYIIGTGINYDHEVFNGRAKFGGFDTYGGYGKDCNGHGTHVAGLAVGNPTGVARGANVYSIKVMDCNAHTFYLNPENGIFNVIERVKLTKRRSVICLAFVPNVSSLDAAVRYAISDNIVVVTNAGSSNKNTCTSTPSGTPGVINVGAIQQTEDDRYPGKHTLMLKTNYGECVHVFAPGRNIYSASHVSNTELVSKSGVFAACGIVAGVAATLLQRFPDYTPYQIRDQLIKESTKDAINFHTRNRHNLSSIIAETTPNRLAYTGRCINTTEETTPPGLQNVTGKKINKKICLKLPGLKNRKEKKKLKACLNLTNRQ